MYYIVNETNQIIAADESLLTLCEITHINELNSNITLEKLTFQSIVDNQLVITQDINSHTFSIKQTPLSSLLGKLTLITLQSEKTTNNAIKTNFDKINIDDLIIKTSNPLNTVDTSEPLFDLSLKEESDDFNLSDETLDITPIDNSLTLIEDTNIFLKDKHLTENIEINSHKLSTKIGISEEDFNLFLNEYIDTALDLEQDLKSSDTQIQSSAIQTLLHLGEVLHLDMINDILKNINTNSNSIQAITSFYDALSRITTTKIDNEETIENEHILYDLDINEDTNQTEIHPSNSSFGDINLSQVVPIEFDLELSLAAKELLLPENLIEEFMIDFIDQGHAETTKMLNAYKEGNLDNINKIGHLLKGISSNLHITKLSDTLHKIQYCENSNHLEDLIKDYWGHFLYFEQQINILSTKGNK